MQNRIVAIFLCSNICFIDAFTSGFRKNIMGTGKNKSLDDDDLIVKVEPDVTKTDELAFTISALPTIKEWTRTLPPYLMIS